MMPIFLGIAFGIILLFGSAYLICKLIDRLTIGSKRQMKEDSKKFVGRLKNPQPEAIAQHFGHSLPAALLGLYQNGQEIHRDNFEVGESEDAFEDGDDSWYIAFYEPLDLESLKYALYDSEKYLAFANDGFGNAYMVDPRLEDPPVLFHDHETGETSHVCAKLSEFLKWPRKLDEQSEMPLGKSSADKT